MGRTTGLIHAAAFAAVAILASCYNEASNSNDGGTAGGPSGLGPTGPNGSTSTSTSSANGGGGSSSSAEGGGGSASTASASGGNNGGAGGSTGSGDGGAGTGTSSGGATGSSSTGSMSTGSGSSSTGSGGAPPTGQHYVTYIYDLPPGLDADIIGLTIYDQASNGSDVMYVRPNPWNMTEYGSTYAWGVAADSEFDTDCASFNDPHVDCVVMRPAYAHVEVNVHLQFSDIPTRWSCESPHMGTFQLFIDGVPTGFAYEPWPDAPGGPACRYFFILPP